MVLTSEEIDPGRIRRPDLSGPSWETQGGLPIALLCVVVCSVHVRLQCLGVGKRTKFLFPLFGKRTKFPLPLSWAQLRKCNCCCNQRSRRFGMVWQCHC